MGEKLTFDSALNRAVIGFIPRPINARVISQIAEDNGTKEIKITPQDAEFYIDRLTRVCELRWEIDSGNYPLTHYSSGERKEKRTPKGVVETDEFVYLPIYKDPQSPVKGLRFGVLHTIFETAEMLGSMGLRQVADEILVFDAGMPKGNQHGK